MKKLEKVAFSHFFDSLGFYRFNVKKTPDVK